MLATEKPRARLARRITPWMVMLLALTACGPPGPRALLQGEKLIQQGEYQAAIDKLRLATELLPKNAQAWNHLGLAYHGAGLVTNAVTAYRKALMLDRDLMVVHYNLGCLWLDQNNLPAAIEEFTSYVSHPRESKSVDGWTKLGTAYLRTRRPDDAEKAFLYVTKRLEARSPEALNNLGIIQMQRRRASDAAGYFNAALAVQTNYGPALVNLAVVYQQQPSYRHLALQKYREYLALNPKPANWDAVEAIASQLDAEINTPQLRPVQSNTLVAATRTNLTSPLATPPPLRATSTVAAVHGIPATTKSGVTPPSSSTAPGTSSRPPLAATTSPPPKAANVPPVKPTVVEPPPTPPTVASKPPDLEVARVGEDLVIKPALDVPSSPTPSSSTKSNLVDRAADPALANIGRTPPKPAKAPKRSLIDRLNPFARRSKDTSNAPASITSTQIPVQPAPVTVEAKPPPAASTVPAYSGPRYSYQNPPPPSPGNRTEAEKQFREAVKAQNLGQRSQALAAFKKAAEADPSFFEAHFNQALMAYGLGNWAESLTAYETALALKPDSIDSRYNFALALRQGGYPQDAADEMQRILKGRPNDVRVHLSLGNLYAQQLKQPARARAHYGRVLEIDPRHAQAAQIRYWLAANP